ncbi:MAG: MarR family transcriptional regulator [Clostridia bacterium]|nr:MarR family transcriptional regulator [Clostridia bacterium]
MGIMRSISQTVRAYALFKEERLAQYGLSGNQSLYLRVIISKPGISQEELAANLVFNKSSVSRQVAALEKAGLVRQERSPNDRRNLLVYATKEGQALLDPIMETSKEFFSLITADLSPDQKAQLDELCQKICVRAKEAIQSK